jgi:L-cysteine:1D-myo-inositol 2-amino-2-deoxy-alpha-D-glucopyranoside ligase
MDYDDMLATANERGNYPDDPNKRDPLDFVIWQAADPARWTEKEPRWESPWGQGRPGWHIECSTMSTKFLGETIDIHSGGADLLFPHHCCEMAQIEPLTGQPFVRFWMHTAMVRHEGDKMSKSLGNLVWARELLQNYSADALRLYMASHHYAIEWSHDPGVLDWASLVAERIRAATVAHSGSGAPFDPAAWELDFNAALADNLNSPRAVSILDDLAVNVLLASQRGEDLTSAQQKIRAFSSIFGLVLDSAGPDEEVVAGWTAHLEKFTGR